jgi:hypothetical protein
MLAEALLNPPDRPYTVKEFFRFIDGPGLRFARWIRQAEYSPECGLFRHSPHRSTLHGLTELCGGPDQSGANSNGHISSH